MPRLRLRPFLFLAASASLLCLPACTECRGTIAVVSGEIPVKPGQTLQLLFRYEGEVVSGPSQCNGHWYVNDVEGGNDEVGLIDSCGRYSAPAGKAGTVVQIVASLYPADGCADCCPYATMDIAL